MHTFDESCNLSPDEQMRQVAMLLAAGILRLRRPLETSPERLELGGETVLSVRAVNGPESPEKRR
jgi:hypothetical protein